MLFERENVFQERRFSYSSKHWEEQVLKEYIKEANSYKKDRCWTARHLCFKCCNSSIKWKNV